MNNQKSVPKIAIDLTNLT